MICTECFIREGQHFITVETNGIFETIKICTECLNAKNKAASYLQFSSEEKQNKEEMNLNESKENEKEKEFLQEQENADIERMRSGRKEKTEVSAKCNHCGFLESDFEASGYLGCSECYKTFESLNEVIDMQQGKGVIHKGKRLN